MNESLKRKGFVLVLAILSLVVIGGLIVATHAAVLLDHGVSVATLNRQRAFAASEHGLWHSVANWDPANSALPSGGARKSVIRVAGDSAIITTVRLNDAVYWITAEARVGGPAGRAAGRSGINVRVVSDSAGARIVPLPRSWTELH